MTSTPSADKRSAGLVLRFVCGLCAGAATGAGVWLALMGTHATAPSAWQFGVLLVAVTVLVAAATWWWKPSAGAGTVVGLAFGYSPVFGVWAKNHITGLWPTWMIMALTGMLLFGAMVVVVVFSIRLKITGRAPEDTGAGLDIPDSRRSARRTGPTADIFDD
ncbi:hypothetical protein ACFSSC_06610 [Corynebacterium mendelii]|uniref:Uncharacterized protein n=1 Tax=Corynebacterium mendelii TaxID=2765362 RepID=A0A939E1J3_9CORY|nr:hypothetical protein [Corynebacterium mendelii]MBN9644998.1 hypothetical protein [Corynebacterium mendelii]